MKNFQCYLLFLILFTNIYCFAQSDPNNDPNWSWLSEPAWKLYPATLPVGSYIQPNNPFYQSGIGAAVYDNLPEDGWILIQRDFGTTTRQVSPTPYLILYNKYQGLLRIFVYLMLEEGYNHGSIKVYADNSGSSTVSLNFMENIFWGRNDINKVKDRNGAATAPVVNNSWTFADYPIAYDPSVTSKNNPRLQFQIWGIDDYNISIDGMGTMNQIFGANSPSNVANPGLFQQGGLFDAAGKKIAGTQETWIRWQSTIEKIGQKIPANSTSPSLQNLKSWINNVMNTWTIGNLGLIGAGVGLVDFLITGGRETKKEQPAPMNYLLNFSLSGGMTTSDQVGMVTLPLPGGNHTWSYSTNLLYNQPLGILNLTSSPILQHRIYWWPHDGQYTKTHSYRIKDDLLFDFNLNADLEITNLQAAFVFELMGSPANNQLFLDYADGSYNLIDGTPIQLESFNNEKYVFRTPYMDANTFRYQKITLPEGGGFNLYVKIKAEFKVHNSTLNRQPVVFIATYDANIEEDTGGSPWPQPFHAIVTRQFEFEADQLQPTQYGFIGDPITIETPQTIGSYQFVMWSDGNASLTREVSSNFVGKAIYKISDKTNNTVALKNNNLQHIVRSNSGHLHKVYSSMYYVWYEKSVDGGQTWTIANGGKPLGVGNFPTIDYYSSSYDNGENGLDLQDNIVVVFQSERNIVVQYFVDGVYQFESVFEDVTLLHSEHKPIVACNDNGGDILIVYNYAGYLKYCYGTIVPSDQRFHWDVEHQNIRTEQDQYALEHSISNKKYTDKYQLVWNENYQSIQYLDLKINTLGNNIIPENRTTISTGCGYPVVYMPDISVKNSDGNPSITWVGTPYYNSSSSKVIYRTGTFNLNGTLTWGSFTQLGSSNRSPVINYADNNSLCIGWVKTSPIQLQIYKPKYISTLATDGQYIHLTNGSDYNHMYALSQNSYDFTTSNVFSINKPLEVPLSSGRGSVIITNEAEIYNYFGDVTLDGYPINFPDLSDTILVNSISDINEYMTSDIFTVNNEGLLNFTFGFEFLDSLNIAEIFASGKWINYKLLLYNSSREFVTEIFSKTLDANSTIQNIFENYSLNFSDLTGDYYIKLELVTNVVGSCNLIQLLNDSNCLPKSNATQIQLKNLIVTDYRIDQNYPNPFNPTTTINYQIPKEGFVTLKIYDILGNEIKTLVAGQKFQGKHSVNFDASNLASGVYVYRIQVDAYNCSKKMIFVK